MPKFASSIQEFCLDHGFSRATYYNLPTDKRPTEMHVNGRVLISTESGAEWRRRMEAAQQEVAQQEAE